MKILTKLKKWYQGKWIEYPNERYSPFPRVLGGYYKKPFFAKVLQILGWF